MEKESISTLMAVYIKVILRGNRCGHGIQYWPDESTYEEDWQNGIMHGKGVYHYSDGRLCEGYFQNGVKCGQGIEKWPDGASYDGEWKDDAFHGKGVRHWSDGIVYEGYFQNGVRSGKGVVKSPDVDSYEGEHMDDKYHGFGVIIGLMAVFMKVNGRMVTKVAMEYSNGQMELATTVSGRMTNSVDKESIISLMG